jgi:hypothetical protein
MKKLLLNNSIDYTEFMVRGDRLIRFLDNLDAIRKTKSYYRCNGQQMIGIPEEIILNSKGHSFVEETKGKKWVFRRENHWALGPHAFNRLELVTKHSGFSGFLTFHDDLFGTEVMLTMEPELVSLIGKAIK